MAKWPFPLNRDRKCWPPDWRWRLAVYLTEHPDDAAAQALADLWVVQILLLLRMRHDPHTGSDASWNTVRAACGHYGATDPMVRAIVEGHLLTGEPLEQVAPRCGVARDVLGDYRAVYFDVSGQGQASAYITHHLIGMKMCTGLSERDQGILVRLAGYRGRGDLIGGLVRQFRGPALTATDFEVSDPAAVEKLRERLRVKLWVVSQTLPFNEVMAQATDILSEVEKLLDPPAERCKAGVNAAAARLQRANQALDELRACIASARP
jgi:hypothetical protein